jgi:hypothetical protein
MAAIANTPAHRIHHACIALRLRHRVAASIARTGGLRHGVSQRKRRKFAE